MSEPATLSQSTAQASGFTIRTIGFDDLGSALRRGIEDFKAFPSHGIFLCLIYPVIGIFLCRLAFGYDVLPLLFPLAAGFALIGPFAAIGLYELSRRREKGLEAKASDALTVLSGPGSASILIMGLTLLAIFFVWIGVANAIFAQTFGAAPPSSIFGFLTDVLTSQRGWSLIVIGNAVGFAFSVFVLAISIVSFPMIIDRKVSASVAVRTSLSAVAQNPIILGAWGVIVALALLIGSLPFLAGLALVLPILGHATWHLYRRLVA